MFTPLPPQGAISFQDFMQKAKGCSFSDYQEYLSYLMYNFPEEPLKLQQYMMENPNSQLLDYFTYLGEKRFRR